MKITTLPPQKVSAPDLSGGIDAATLNKVVRSQGTTEHPAPWWYKLASALLPERCREIPEAVNPERIVLRQVAIVKRYVYLQQFAGSEDERYLHSHQWLRTVAVGLWGAYVERRLNGPEKLRRAPYFYTMGSDVIHQVITPSAGHTSIFVGLWRDDDLKRYFGMPWKSDRSQVEIRDEENKNTYVYDVPLTLAKPWDQHIIKQVKRI